MLVMTGLKLRMQLQPIPAAAIHASVPNARLDTRLAPASRAAEEASRMPELPQKSCLAQAAVPTVAAVKNSSARC